MQKSWKVVLLTTIGLILELFPLQVFGNVVWESLQNNTPSIFKGYDKMFIVNLTHKDFVTEKFIEDLIGTKATLVSINDPQQQFEAMRLSHLSLYITTIEKKNLSIVSLSARAMAKTDVSKTNFLSTLWEKEYILADITPLSLQQTIKNGLSYFFLQYFKDNSANQDKPKFYLFH